MFASVNQLGSKRGEEVEVLVVNRAEGASANCSSYRTSSGSLLPRDPQIPPTRRDFLTASSISNAGICAS